MQDIVLTNRDGQRQIQFVEQITLIVAVFTSIAMVGWVIWRAGYGYDFSDEGHYLNWISNPQLYKASVTQFGFIYHPFYRLVDGDIALLRRANILATLGFAWILSALILQRTTSLVQPAKWNHNLRLPAVALLLSTSTLSLLQYWLPTPSYDSLNLQALLIAGMGIILAKRKASRTSVLGWLLIGVAGWLTFMAKPTSAAALSIVVSLYLVISGKFNIRLLSVAVTTAVVIILLSAWIIDGSIANFVMRLINGADDARKLQGGHTLFETLRVDDFSLSPIEWVTLASGTAINFLATYFIFFSEKNKRIGIAAITLLIYVFWLAALMKYFDLSLFRSHFLGLQYWAAPFGVFLAFAIRIHRKLFDLISRDDLALVSCLLVFPHVFVFGHNGNYWEGASGAAIFWVLAGVVLLGSFREYKIHYHNFLPMAAVAHSCTAALLFLSMEYPYRQTQPLSQNMDVMKLNGTDSTLLVSHQFAVYVEKFKQLATEHGFKAGQPILDLTGHYPGALYVLGAYSVGRSWIIGGYKGSDDLAIAALDRVPHEELGRAWILTEPSGPRKISSDILRRYGIDLAKNYIEVGVIHSPTGSYPDSYAQHLFKPSK